uniref:OTU domain-containing protein n=1 Tax=viral metagenome TaxID=1070528 RepID=A0A6C0KXF7_9ZZZZ
METLFAEKPLLGAPYNTELNVMKRHPLTAKNSRRIRTILKTFIKKQTTAKSKKTKQTRKIQINWLQRLEEQTREQTNTKPVTVKKTLSNGDCFYSSIYRAAKERPGILNRLKTCLRLNIDSETAFIQSFRDKVARTIRRQGLQKENSKDIYDYLQETAALKDGTYEAIMDAYPNWFTTEFGTEGEHLATKADFIKRLLKHVTKQGEWVGEIETRQVMELLPACEIRVKIHSNEAKFLPLKTNGHDILQLYNPGEAHYEYFSFEPADCAEGKERNPKTRRCIKVCPPNKVRNANFKCKSKKRIPLL